MKKNYLIHIIVVLLFSIVLYGCGSNMAMKTDTNHELEEINEEETQPNMLLTDNSFEFSWNQIAYHKEENSLFIEFNTNLPDDTIVHLSLTPSQPDSWGDEYKDFYEYSSRLEQKGAKTTVADGMIRYTFKNSDFNGDLLPNAIYYVLLSILVYDDVNSYIKEQYSSKEDFEASYPNLEHDFWITDHDLANYNDYELKFHLKEEVQTANSLEEILTSYEENTVPFQDVEKNPSQYVDTYVKYTGEVIEIHEMEDSEALARTNSTLRLAVNGENDQVLLVLHQSTNGMESVYEGDEITVYGNLLGSYTYKSQAGYEITIPAMYAIIYVE